MSPAGPEYWRGDKDPKHCDENAVKEQPCQINTGTQEQQTTTAECIASFFETQKSNVSTSRNSSFIETLAKAQKNT